MEVSRVTEPKKGFTLNKITFQDIQVKLFRVTTRLRDGSDRGGSGGFVVGRIGSRSRDTGFSSSSLQIFYRELVGLKFVWYQGAIRRMEDEKNL